MILSLRAAILPKKDTSCNLNSQHCIQERNEYNNREFQTELVVKGGGLSRDMFEKESEEILV